MTNQGYLKKAHVQLVLETLRQLEQENLRWSRNPAPIGSPESLGHLTRLYVIAQPVSEAMKRLENDGGREQP